MSGSLERFITSIRNFLTRPQEEEEEAESAYPLHRTTKQEEEEEEESSEVTFAEGAGFVVKREVEA